jgi:hypothetical protein
MATITVRCDRCRRTRRQEGVARTDLDRVEAALIRQHIQEGCKKK